MRAGSRLAGGFQVCALAATFVLAPRQSRAQTFDLTGMWRDDNGVVVPFRQAGSKFCWYGDARPRVQSVFCGTIAGNTITGDWLDLPGGQLLGTGQLTLRIESNDRVVKTGSSSPYGASTWTRVGAMSSAAPTAAASVGGNWSLVCCNGKYKAKVTLNQNGNRITGFFADPGNNSNIGNLEGTLSGSTLRFTRTVQGGHQDYVLTLNSDGSKLTGTFEGLRDPSVGTDVTATRVP